MRPSRWIFGWVLINLACIGAGLYWIGLLKTSRGNAVSKIAPAKKHPRETFARVEPLVAGVVTNDFRWAQLESEDYHEYIARLRKIGCPEETIRDIIIADIDKLFAPRVASLRSSTNEPRYWRADEKELINHVEALQRLRSKRGVDYEKRQVVRDLLGVDLVAERSNTQGEEDFYGRRLGKAVAPEKLDQLRIIVEETNQEEMALREKSWLEGEALTAADKQQLGALQNEKEKRLAALLSPEELDQYNLWFSSSAYKVRDSLFGMDATEDEFLALYKLRSVFDGKWGSAEAETLDPSQRQEWNLELGDLETKIQQALGPERYAVYQRSQDGDYRQLRITAAEFNLPPESAEEVYGFKQTFKDQRQALLSNAAVSLPAKEQILRAMQEESERAVVEVIGPKAYQFYLRTGAGQWLIQP